MKKTILLSSIFLLSLASCKQKTKDENIQESDQEIVENQLKTQGDSLTTVTQQFIVKNLTEAIQKEGLEYAVDFCNINAIGLTNSAVEHFNGKIQRISDKNRNSDNNLKTQTDKDIFESFRKNEKLNDSLFKTETEYVYYKRINLAMPTCIQCHGKVEEINPKVLSKIQKHYPNDKAQNYELNDFRGLWKVTFNASEN